MKPSYSDKQRKKTRLLQQQMSNTNIFKPGDYIRHKGTGEEARVREVPGMPSYDMHGYAGASHGFVIEKRRGGTGWCPQSEWVHDHQYVSMMGPTGPGLAGPMSMYQSAPQIIPGSSLTLAAMQKMVNSMNTPPLMSPVTSRSKPKSKKKETSTFKVGDRVRVIDEFAGNEMEDAEGRVCAIRGGGREVGVEFDNDIDGHDCDGKAKNGHGRWGPVDELELISRAKKPKLKLKLTHLDSLVIAESVKNEIISTLKQIENHDKIFKKWGLGSVIEYGKGMTFMFWGLPGTGKTYGANQIAKALNTTLLTLSAGDVQSSEPGAANRNIEQAFKTAHEKNQVLFIDECDSLIFDRGQLGMVLASEVNTLLTCIEKFEGVCILATNRIADMDAALERRISLIVEFPMPNLEQRMQIWRNLMPKKLPIGELNITTLARHEISGGMIKNAVLAAARLAAAEKVEMLTEEHFNTAIKRVLSSKNLMGQNRNPRARMDTSTHVDKTVDMFNSYIKGPDKK